MTQHATAMKAKQAVAQPAAWVTPNGACATPTTQAPLHEGQRQGLWLMLGLALACWPQLWWMGERMRDGSDDPLGLLALLALLTWLFSQRPHWRSPARGWVGAALGLALLAGGLQANGPALLAALAAMLALACGARAVLPRHTATAPVLLLAVLSLPLLASLQFFVGYPLRVLVAELTRWGLSAWHSVSRSGAALVVDGQLVLVDAACSGVQLAWLGYFSAACLAAMRQLSSRQVLARLPLVGACVLLGNVLRSAVLVAAQADGQALPTWLHEGIGLLTIALMVLAVSRLMQAPMATPNPLAASHAATWPAQQASPTRQPDWHQPPPFRGGQPLPHGCWVVLLAVLGLQTMVALRQPAPGTHLQAHAEWPRSLNGLPLRPLALSAVEQRFAQQFPGQLARLSNGQDVLTWRHVTRPTRMLHPAVDCFKAIGYQITDHQLTAENMPYPLQSKHASPDARTPPLWRCFMATQGGTRLRVCERIEDAHGQVFTDTSAWYWAAQLGRTTGPWQAITVAHPV